MIRVVTYIHQIPLALDMIGDAHDKGYETTVILMFLSTAIERGLEYIVPYLLRAVVAISIIETTPALKKELIINLLDTREEDAKTATGSLSSTSSR